MHVVVMTYEGWNSTGVLDLSQYFCTRIMASIKVSISLFKREPLPKGTFGTGWWAGPDNSCV